MMQPPTGPSQRYKRPHSITVTIRVDTGEFEHHLQRWLLEMPGVVDAEYTVVQADPTKLLPDNG